MPAPTPSWNLIRLHGTWHNMDGTKKAGSYTVTIPTRITSITDDVIIPPGVYASGRLNVDSGPSLDVMVPATNDPDITPHNWSLNVTIVFNDQSPAEVYNVAPTLTGGAINLRRVVLPSNATPPSAVLLRGVPGGVAELDVDGDVVDSAGVKVGTVTSVTAAQISNATAVGRSVLTAASAATARAAIGAGTSNLAIGTTAGTAKSGDYVGLELGTTADTAKPGDYTPSISDLPFTGTRSASTFARGDGTWAVPPTGSGGTSAVPRLGPVVVASSQAPQAVKDQASFVCDGSNDQTEINAAIVQAARSGDIAGGTGAGKVELVGGDFFVGNNNTGTILLYPGVWVQGTGPNTFINPQYSSYTGLGVFQLATQAVDHTKVSDLTIGKPGSVVSRCHGFNYVGDGASGSSATATGNDRFHWIDHVTVLKTSGNGVFLSGTSGGTRASQINRVVCWESALSGIRVDGSSDNHLTDCNVQTQGGGPGFYIGGGNSKVLNCKSYYSDGSTDGFLVTSSRAELIGCSAQDNGRYGFNITSGDCTVSGCVADSNARTDSSGGGFLIGSDGVFEGLHAFDRGQTPGSPQLRGIVFSGSPQVYLTGRVRVPSGSAHVVGSPGTNSYMRVVRHGTTTSTTG